MADWIVTVPKTVRWEDYRLEMAAVDDRSQVMNYRLARPPRGVAEGDRCFVVWDGRVRGWMEVVGGHSADQDWRCTTTGTVWPAGTYLQRSGPFHEVDGPEMVGFRGIRRYEALMPPKAG